MNLRHYINTKGMPCLLHLQLQSRPAPQTILTIGSLTGEGKSQPRQKCHFMTLYLNKRAMDAKRFGQRVRRAVAL